MNAIRRLAGPHALVVALIVILAACSAGGAASPSPTPAPVTPTPAPTVDPNAPVGSDPSGGGDPGAGDFIVPKPGQLDPRPVPMDGLTATVDGRHVVVIASWTSGVEPCYVLDTVIVEKGDKSFRITLREGHGPGDVACIEIAQLKQTKIDLGELDPGTYTITDSTGGAADIQVTVS